MEFPNYGNGKNDFFGCFEAPELNARWNRQSTFLYFVLLFYDFVAATSYVSMSGKISVSHISGCADFLKG